MKGLIHNSWIAKLRKHGLATQPAKKPADRAHVGNMIKLKQQYSHKFHRMNKQELVPLVYQYIQQCPLQKHTIIQTNMATGTLN